MESQFVRIRTTVRSPSGKLISHQLVDRRIWYDRINRKEWYEKSWKAYDPDRKVEVAVSPYAWWQIWYLVTVPAFYIGLFAYRNLRIKQTRFTTAAAFFFAFLVDGAIGYYLFNFIGHRI